MKRFLVIILTGFIGITLSWSGGESEGAASNTRGTYLADRGIIIPNEEIHIDSYIAAIDYNYPKPESEKFEVHMYTGNRQIYMGGAEEILQIGLQAGKTEFENLPPMNLAFVIDHSGSMAQADKLEWVIDAFDIFIEKVRDTDYVSLVIFDDFAEVIYPATKMDSEEKRNQFKRVVHSITPDGSTNLLDGLQLGSIEVLKNYNIEYTNRVMFLSDGQDTCGNTHEAILELAEQFCEEGVTISTIGVGQAFDLELMVQLARTGAGSSRFISDREEMQKIFGSELDRMVVAQARNLEMTLEFLVDVNIIDTWGYQNVRSGDTVYYYLPTLHNGDYETILVDFETEGQRFSGVLDLARFTVKYEDNFGNQLESGPHIIQAEFVEDSTPLTGFSNGMVLHSGSMLHFAKNLKTIADTYYSGQIRANLEHALNITIDTKKELVNAETRLETGDFTDQIDILNKYLNILGNELEFSEQRISVLSNDLEILSPAPERGIAQHIDYLSREIVWALRSKTNSSVAVCEFSYRGDSQPYFVTDITENVFNSIQQINSITLIDQVRLASTLNTKQFTYSDLTDKTNAIEVGLALNTDYIITGNVIETTNTYIIFSRMINVYTGEVESSAQVIVAK
jgi:TolB-like protein